MKSALSIGQFVIFVMLFSLGTPAAAQQIPWKVGRAGIVTEQWKNVSLGSVFADPIVVAGPLGYADAQPAGVRVRNVTSSSFQVKAQEWDSQDGVHRPEMLNYVAVQRGRYTLSTGKIMLAEKTSVTGGGFQNKTFSQPFTTTPVILATVVTQNEASAVAVQLRNITPNGFQIRLQEQEANIQTHVAETVHYVAWEPGSGILNGLVYEVGTLGVNHDWTIAWFATAFAGTPVFSTFLATSQTAVGGESYSIRCRNLTRARAELRLQEDDSFDTESFHAIETVGYLVLGTPGPPGVGADATFVVMGDSISYGRGDRIPADNYRDGTLPPKGYPPILTEKLAIPPPAGVGKDVLIINEGIPGDLSVEGVRDIPHIINAYPLANYVLLLYGANDVHFNVPSGAGLSSGQSGYAGSFKANMQQMIDAIYNAGKVPIPAYVLYQTAPSADERIRQYNQAITELRVQSSLPIPPPNFYIFFKNNPAQLSDGLHPDGVGYDFMARIWHHWLRSLFP